MDPKLPKEQLPQTPAKTLIRISSGQLPGQPVFYRGSIPMRPTLGLERLAERVVEKRTEYRPSTLLNAFQMMKEEMYSAIEDGFNVDFGLGRTELSVHGRFLSEYEPFDPKRHNLQIHLRPSPRLIQLAGLIPAETSRFYRNQPIVNEASTDNQPRGKQKHPARAFNTAEAGSPILFFYGSRLKLMGDHPDVGITLRRCDTDEERFFTPDQLLINEAATLCLHLPKDFELNEGEWEADIATQYSPNYQLYRTPRHGYHGFLVVETPDA